ncbi:MAG: hypothetical protein GY796_31975 [Chloroflexi bacterium]|nr:hypothetical protein [Chloroflexota bacterium]
MSEQKKLNIILTHKDGWNFGLGFFAAAFVFTFILIPILACVTFLSIAVLGIGVL